MNVLICNIIYFYAWNLSKILKHKTYIRNFCILKYKMEIIKFYLTRTVDIIWAVILVDNNGVLDIDHSGMLE